MNDSHRLVFDFLIHASIVCHHNLLQFICIFIQFTLFFAQRQRYNDLKGLPLKLVRQIDTLSHNISRALNSCGLALLSFYVDSLIVFNGLHIVVISFYPCSLDLKTLWVADHLDIS